MKSCKSNINILTGSTFKWIDNKKCIFSVDIEAVSSVHTENPTLDAFLTKTAGMLENNAKIG